jgi:phosphoglycerol transferase
MMNRLQTAMRRVSAIDGVALALGGLACLALTGYLTIDTALPANFRGDHLFYLVEAKSYIDGHGFRFNPQLGFPASQDTLYFPNFDLSFRLFLWLAAKVSSDPIRNFHALYIAGLLAMFGFAYWALRRFRIRAWIAAAGAVASVVTPYLAARAFEHDYLALSFSAPLGLGLALSLGLQPPGASLRGFLRQPFTIATILVVGASGLYYAFYSLMFVALVGVVASAVQRRWFPILAAACVAFPLFCVMVLGGYGFDLPLVLSGRFAGPHREAFEQLLYGINLPSAALAFKALPWVALGIDKTVQAIPSALAYEGGREWPGLPLTAVIVASPLIAAVFHNRGRETDEGGVDLLRLIGLCAICLVFGLMFGARGGIGYLFNLLITPELRGASRLMPFLNLGAAIILCAAAEMAARAKIGWLRCVIPALIAVLLLAGTRPAYGALGNRQKTNLADPLQQTMRASVPKLLAVKDRAGLQTVLQLPSASWPDEPPIHGFETYSHMVPYLLDKRGSTTRWSYGSSDKQVRSALIRFVVRQPAGLVPRARAFGFDSLLVEKRGYDEAGLNQLKAELGRQLSPACVLYDDDVLTLYALGRAPNGSACSVGGG